MSLASLYTLEMHDGRSSLGAMSAEGEPTMIRIVCLAGITLPLLICACSGGAPASPSATSGQDLRGSQSDAREDGGPGAHQEDGRNEGRDGDADRDNVNDDRDADHDNADDDRDARGEHADADCGHDRDAEGEHADADRGHEVGEADGDVDGEDAKRGRDDDPDADGRGRGGPGPH